MKRFALVICISMMGLASCTVPTADSPDTWAPTSPIDLPAFPRPDLGYTPEVMACVNNCILQNKLQNLQGRAAQKRCACACISQTRVQKNQICGGGLITGEGALTVGDLAPKGARR